MGWHSTAASLLTERAGFISNPATQAQDPTLGLMLCLPLQISKNFQTRSPTFLFCAELHRSSNLFSVFQVAKCSWRVWPFCSSEWFLSICVKHRGLIPLPVDWCRARLKMPFTQIRTQKEAGRFLENLSSILKRDTGGMFSLVLSQNTDE